MVLLCVKVCLSYQLPYEVSRAIIKTGTGRFMWNLRTASVASLFFQPTDPQPLPSSADHLVPSSVCWWMRKNDCDISYRFHINSSGSIGAPDTLISITVVTGEHKKGEPC